MAKDWKAFAVELDALQRKHGLTLTTWRGLRRVVSTEPINIHIAIEDDDDDACVIAVDDERFGT